MQKIIRFLVAFILLGFCLQNNKVFAQAPSAPIIDTPLTTSKTYFYNGEIIVPYSTGHVSVTNNSSVNILSTTEVNLLPGFTASTDSGCSEFEAGIKTCQFRIDSEIVTNIKCFGNNNGSIEVNLIDSIGKVNYFWNDTFYASNKITKLPSGNFTLKAIDSSGCFVEDTIFISEPDSIEITVTCTSSACNLSNGGAQAILTGGIAPYSYFWSTGDTSSFSVQNLKAGFYSIVAQDQNNCSISASFAISDSDGTNFNLIKIQDVTCKNYMDGIAYIVPQLSQGSYTYEWINRACKDSICTRLSVGMNVVKITNQNHCVNFSSILINEPDSLQIDLQALQPNCGQQNGAIITSGRGGNGAYSYIWSNGSTDSARFGLGIIFDTLVLTDRLGCEISTAVELMNSDGPEVSIQIITPISCFDSTDGEIIAVVNSGAPPYIYSWDDSNSNSALRTNLAAGLYKVLVVDSNGCKNASSVQLSDPPRVQPIIYYFNPSSDSTNDGTANVLVTGGQSPYSYYWQQTGEITQIISNVSPGYLAVEVTDNLGCHESTSVNVRSHPLVCAYSNSSTPCTPIPVAVCSTSTCYKDIVDDFNADPTGNWNSQCAFEAASDFFNNRQGNGILNIPPGLYIVGEQNIDPVHSTHNPFWKTGNDVLCFESCNNLIIQGKIVSGLASKIKFDDCLDYGLFDPVTSDRLISDLPFGTLGCGVNLYHKIASVGVFIYLKDCNNITINNLDIDGNSDNLSYGGHYCDGIQVPATGIISNSTTNLHINSLNVHHFGQDGLVVYDNSTPQNHSDLVIEIQNSNFNWNGRCGFYWGGGRNIEAINCQFNYNALARFGSKAADGIDFEYFGGNPLENGIFENCEFKHNLYSGIECQRLTNSNYVRDILFKRCIFASSESNTSSWAAIPGGKNFDFQGCSFYGSITGAFHDRDCLTCYNNDYIKFRPLIQSLGLINCTFSEELNNKSMNSDLIDECNSGVFNIGHFYLIDFTLGAARAFFDRCLFSTNKQMNLFSLSGGQGPANWIYLKNCYLENLGLNSSYYLGYLRYYSAFQTNLNATDSQFYFTGNTGDIPTLVTVQNANCVPKYRNYNYPNAVIDAYNCDGCSSIRPKFCPTQCGPPNPPCNLRESLQLAQIQSFGNLLVSPNPSNFIIHIEGLAEQYEIEIYNLLGECVLTFKLNDSKIDLDIRNLIAGIYLIKNGQINSSKLIVLNH